MGFLVQCSQCGTLFAKGLCPKCGHVEDRDIVERQRWIVEQFRQRKLRFETHWAVFIGLSTALLVTSGAMVALVCKAPPWEWRKLIDDPQAHDIGAIVGGLVLLTAWVTLGFLWHKAEHWWPRRLACPGCDAPLGELTDHLCCPECGVPLFDSPVPVSPPPPRRGVDPARTPSPASPFRRRCWQTGQRRLAPLEAEAAPADEPEPPLRDTDGLLALAVTAKEHVRLLPWPQQEMLQLRIEGYEPREIAAKTERSTRTVEWCLQEVRKRLKDMVNAQD